MLKPNNFRIISAVRNEDEFFLALNSRVEIIFDLNPDLLTVKETVARAHNKGKKIFIHLDLANGIGKDKSGLLFVVQAGVDGIISTRVNIIKLAREVGLFTVQRFFIVDSHSADTTAESLKSSKADMIEIMPGVAKTISIIKDRVNVPIIAGGLINTTEDVIEAINSGAMAISTGNINLWN